MISETTTVVGIEADCLWVEGVQRSTCGSCSARAGCGQRMLAGMGATTPRVRILLSGADSGDYQLGENVEIAIPQDVVVKGSLFVYLLPLLGLLLCAGLADYCFGDELLTAGAGLAGLFGGGLVVAMVSAMLNKVSRFQPRVLGPKLTSAL